MTLPAPTLKPVRLGDIDPGPGVNRALHPLRPDLLAELDESVRRHGLLTSGVLLREVPKGRPQLIHGHHPVEAAKRILGEDAVVILPVITCTAAEALMIAARRKTKRVYDVGMVMELEQRALTLFRRGEMEELRAKEADPRSRCFYAPSVKSGFHFCPEDDDYPYTLKGMAVMLGLTNPNSDEPNDMLKAAHGANQLVQDGVATPVQFAHLNTSQAAAIVNRARFWLGFHEKKAELAEEEAKQADAADDVQAANVKHEQAADRRKLGKSCAIQLVRLMEARFRECEGVSRTKVEADRLAESMEKSAKTEKAKKKVEPDGWRLAAYVERETSNMAEQARKLCGYSEKLCDDETRARINKALEQGAEALLRARLPAPSGKPSHEEPAPDPSRPIEHDDDDAGR